MRLHLEKSIFEEAIKVTAEKVRINPLFIEKDYWITLVLNRLAKSNYNEQTVFKGGTSLSKGYNLIERFSEDVDIAILNDRGQTGNEIKTIIRSIEKEITQDLKELQIDGVTSKGSRFRKSVFEYDNIDRNNQNNKLIVEINSFANPYPYQKLTIKSFICEFFQQTGNDQYIDKYNLQPFSVNTLSKEQTLLEKTVSLIRFSFDENPIESISKKIRHFYDLFFLMNNSECAEFVASDLFKKQFETILQHDREMFEEPWGWQTRFVNESLLINDFSALWQKLRTKYLTELSALAYRAIPNEESVAKKFIQLIDRIK